MKKLIWEIGGMNSVFPQRIDTLKIDNLLEDYLIFEILEDGELGFEIPLIDDNYLHTCNRISYSKDKKTWIHTDINEYIPVKKGEIWYCKGECCNIGTYSIGHFSGINGLDKIKYNVSGNISAILDIRKENPDTEKILIEMVEGIDKELLKLQSPEEALISIYGEEVAFIVIEAIKYSDKNKTPAHFRNLLISVGVPDVPGLSDEEFIKLFILEETGGNLELESVSCVAWCLLLGNEFRSLELPPKLDELFQSEDVVDASGLVIDYSTTCIDMFADCYNLIKAPELPMTTLLSHCYSGMFADCSSLTTAPALPAITLADACYNNMFDNCTSLTTTPKLPAVILADVCYSGMFQNCTSLITASALPATTLTSNCYNYMFQNCTSLITAPELPATTLADSCYDHMFSGCSSLTEAPELPAITLTNYCYSGMFQDCTSLTTVPELSATALTINCYTFMFRGCTNLINTPALPATTLANNCYSGMFEGCTNLTSAPVLPATTLTDYCYQGMFRDCINLTTASELPATALADGCYSYMFNSCSKLNKITMLATDISAYDCLGAWVSGVASNGTFVKHPDMTTLPSGPSGIPEGWTASSYFTIKALEDGLTAKLNTSVSTDVCEYRIDNGSWNTLSAGSNTTSINTGQTLSFKGNLTVNSTSGIGTFTISKNCLVQGNIMSLLYSDDFIGQNDLSDKTCAFNELFANCNTLTDASNLILPATLANRCYKNMFYGCTSLVNAPELPATTLADECYINMFEGCTSLVSAPELPATTLANSCYSSMFKGCTGLTSAPVLPATTLVDNCYSYMFYGCILLTNVPTVLPVTTLADGCYRHMFDNCTSLTTAPALFAATLQTDCYEGMFQNCSNLNNIVMLATDISASGCLNNWTSGVATTGTFAKVSSMTSLPTGTSGIPEDWTVSDVLTSGVCGETLTWYFDNSSLVIEGSGDMYDYDSAEAAPWASVATYATSIVLPDDITRIGNNAFAGCSSVAKLTFDDNDCVFGTNAFNSNTKTYLIIDDAEKKDFAMHPNTYYQVIIKRKLDTTNYGTIVMPFAPSSLTRNKFKFYLIKLSGLGITYSRVYGPSANVPYLYKNSSSSSSLWASELSSVYNVTIKATENPEKTTGEWKLIGSYKNLYFDDPELLPYLYAMSGGKLINYTTSLSVFPFRAYFKGIKYDDWVNSNT